MNDLQKLVDEAMSRFNELSPEEQLALRQAQRESFVRGMNTPCKHGQLDFEQCTKCRECPSCHGLNLSCPDGCQRDPKTGRLLG